jgi:hypothetical protein
MGIFSGIWKAVTKPFKKILSWLVPSPDAPGAQAVTVEKQGSDHAIPVVYGTRRIGGIKVHKYVTDASGGAKNEFLNLIIVFCEGPIESISELYFDGVSENDSRWNKQGGGRWFTVQRCLGADGQQALTTGIPNWTGEHRLQGIAYVHLRLQMDESQSIWRGEPEVTALIIGRKIYDPRKNLTLYSENLPLQMLDYLTNNRYGKGLGLSRIHMQSFIDAAYWVDEQITSDVTINGVTSAVTYARITGNLVIDTGKSVFSNVKQMLSGMRGMMPIGSGQLRLVCEKEGDPVFFFGHGRSTKQNYALITGPIKSKAGRKNDRYNRVIIRFPNKLTNYERDEVHYPEANDPLFAEWLAEDNGVLLEQSFEFDTITNKAEVYQMAEIIAKRSRNRMEVSFSASPPAIVVEPGDIVGISDDTRGWDEKPFRVEQCKLREDGDVEFEFIEHQDAIYPWSGVEYSERVGGTNLGDPTNIPAPVGLSIEPDPTFSTSGTLRWSNANNAFIRRYQILVTADSTEVYRVETMGLSWSIPLLAPGSYVISLRALSTLNTLSLPALIPINLLSPIPPSDIHVVVGNFEIEAAPVLSGIGLGTQFEMAINSTAGLVYGPGANFVFVSLKHGTEYTLFSRTVNALGRSEWMSKVVKTTSDGSNIIDLISDGIGESILPEVIEQISGDIGNIISDVIKVNEQISSTRQNLIEDALQILDDADERIRRQSGQKKLQQSIRNETEQRETSVEIIRTQLNDEVAQRQSEVVRIEQSVTTLQQTTASTLTEVNSRIDNANFSIAANSNAIQFTSATVNGHAVAIQSLNTSVGRIDTSLLANTQLLLNSELTPAGDTKATVALRASVTGLSTQQNAISQLLVNAGLDSSGNTKATAALQTSVNSISGNLSSVQLSLSSVSDELGDVSGRAYLGVTTTVGGVARVNGLVIDGATNAIEFRSDTLRLTNTAGVTQLYYNTDLAKWIFSGDLIAGTFATATSGFRAEMSGAGSFPLWYGTGSKTPGNASFSVDTAGNVVLRNATMQGAFLSAAGTGYRVEINNDATYAIWIGAGEKTDINGLFWIKFNGQGFLKGDLFQGQIIESKAGGASNTSGTLIAYASNHQSAGKPVKVSAQGTAVHVRSGNYASLNLTATVLILRGGAEVSASTYSTSGVFEPDDGPSGTTRWYLSYLAIGIDTRTVAETRNYAAQVNFVGPVGSAVQSRNVFVDTFENKLAS